MQVSLTFMNPMQSEDCYEKRMPTRTPDCSEECTVRRDQLDPFDLGNYTVEWQFVHCEDLWEQDGEYHTCDSFTLTDAERYVACEAPQSCVEDGDYCWFNSDCCTHNCNSVTGTCGGNCQNCPPGGTCWNGMCIPPSPVIIDVVR